jgi:8-hydroxy-5-deazaflavin:NADPH oxidoreductase
MDSKTIGVLGGTGPAGSAVAVRIAAAGYTVLLGSREATKAQAKVDELHARFPGRLGGLRGVDNAIAAATDVAILATVADSIIPTATEHAAALAGRVVICMANLLQKTPRGFAAVFPPEGSVAEAVQVIVPTASVIGAFQNLPAAALGDLDSSMHADVMVTGDDKAAVRMVIDLIDGVDGLVPIDAGPLSNTSCVEGLTAILINVNRARKGEHSVLFAPLH